jgi:hypothetical protein
MNMHHRPRLGTIHGCSLPYFPGIMGPAPERQPAPPQPVLKVNALRCIQVLRHLSDAMTTADIIRARTGIENGSRCANILWTLKGHGLVESERTVIAGRQSATYRLTPAGLAEQAAWGGPV